MPAVDYQLKPFGPGRLSAAMERVRAAIRRGVHRAHIVNLDHVRAFKRDDRGNLEAEAIPIIDDSPGRRPRVTFPRDLPESASHIKV